MKVKLIFIGKTKESYLVKGIDEYEKRLKKYLKLEISVIPDLKTGNQMNFEEIKLLEGKKILSLLKPNNLLILLDDKGKMFSSEDFAKDWQKKFNSVRQTIVMVVGGAYGFSQEIYDRSNELLSLSKMTFSHQMVRLFLLEQIYRSMTILKNEPYHH